MSNLLLNWSLLNFRQISPFLSGRWRGSTHHYFTVYVSMSNSWIFFFVVFGVRTQILHIFCNVLTNWVKLTRTLTIETAIRTVDENQIEVKKKFKDKINWCSQILWWSFLFTHIILVSKVWTSISNSLDILAQSLELHHRVIKFKFGFKIQTPGLLTLTPLTINSTN